MIPKAYIKKSQISIPWQKMTMVEQDMIISRAIVDIYNNPVLAENLIFRGGTALNKIFLDPPSRYSEDIDFVITKKQRIGLLLDEIRDTLSWLGKPKTSRDKYGFKAIFKFENISGLTSKLKMSGRSAPHHKVIERFSP